MFIIGNPPKHDPRFQLAELADSARDVTESSNDVLLRNGLRLPISFTFG